MVLIHKGKQDLKRRVLVYGDNGIGKSTFACQFPDPIVLNLEDGIGDIDCEHTSKLNCWGDFVSAVSWLIQNPHDYKTVVVDSVDWLETMILADVAQKHGKESYQEIEFGRGAGDVVKRWTTAIGGLVELWKNRCMYIVFTAHELIEEIKSPEGTYSRFSPKLHPKLSQCVPEWCDEVLRATSRVTMRQEKGAFGATRNLATGGVERILICQGTATTEAKNRLGMPVDIPLDIDSYAAYVTAAKQKPAGNVAGVVVDGSSKTEE